MWRDVLTFLESVSFDDLLIPGWVDRTTSPPTYRPSDFDVYLRADTGLLEFSSVASRGGLRIRLTEAIVHADDPDDEWGALSVGGHYLPPSDSARCTGMRLFTNDQSVPEDGVFRAAEMTFADTYRVFIDPFWGDGIRLSSGATPDSWLAEQRSPDHEGIFGSLREFSWEAPG
ncbi:hypothetical protein AB0L06_35060 [Spirillospora sp. NPDC052269]